MWLQQGAGVGGALWPCARPRYYSATLCLRRRSPSQTLQLWWRQACALSSVVWIIIWRGAVFTRYLCARSQTRSPVTALRCYGVIAGTSATPAKFCSAIPMTRNILPALSAFPRVVRGAALYRALQHPELLERAGGDTCGYDRASCAERLVADEQSLLINHRIAVEAADMLAQLLLSRSLRRYATYVDGLAGTSYSRYAVPPDSQPLPIVGSIRRLILCAATGAPV